MIFGTYDKGKIEASIASQFETLRREGLHRVVCQSATIDVLRANRHGRLCFQPFTVTPSFSYESQCTCDLRRRAKTAESPCLGSEIEGS